MPYNELRKDYLLDRWVVIATDRARRPSDLSKQRPEQPKNSNCPLCLGNESCTPPAVLAYLQSGDGQLVKTCEEGDQRSKNWLIRSIPNLYPAFTPPKTVEDANHIMTGEACGYAVGHHEVLVESPNHDDQPSDESFTQLAHVVNAYKDRLFSLSQKPYVKYVQIFRNYRQEAGASLSHAHSQIVALPFVPANVKAEHDASQRYFQQTGRCIFCDTAKQEAQTERLILKNEHFTVFAPYASVFLMEFWIVPNRHSADFNDLNNEETAAFVKTLQTTLKALKTLLNDPPYNYGIHLASSSDLALSYHWHLEVYPQLSIWAGFEKSTGMYINTVAPESAAQELRKVINQNKES